MKVIISKKGNGGIQVEQNLSLYYPWLLTGEHFVLYPWSILGLIVGTMWDNLLVLVDYVI